MAPKVAIVIYSMYGHIAQMAEEVKKGIEEAGGSTEILQLEETLSEEVLAKMYAPPKPAYRTISDPKDLLEYDAFVFGIPTRYGNFPGQWKAFIDKTGGIWSSGGFYGKYVGLFISTGTLGGGQESTAIAAMSTLAHHGMIYVPLGYAKAFPLMADLTEVHGGSPWGSGSFAAADGSRQPSDKEKELARIQGKVFYETVSKVNFCLSSDTEKNGTNGDSAKNGAGPSTVKNGTHKEEPSVAAQAPKEKKSSDKFCGLKCNLQ